MPGPRTTRRARGRRRVVDLARGGGRERPLGGGALRPATRRGPFHVGVLLGNVPEYLFALFGAARSGVVIVGINETRRGEELARDVRHTDCVAVLTDAAHAPLLAGLDLGDTDVIDIGSAEWRDRARRPRRRQSCPDGSPDGRPGPDLHLGIHGRPQGGQALARPGRSRCERRDLAHRRRRPLLRDAALPRQRAQRDRLPGRGNGCDDRAAGALLRFEASCPTCGATARRSSAPSAARSRTSSPPLPRPRTASTT